MVPLIRELGKRYGAQTFGVVVVLLLWRACVQPTLESMFAQNLALAQQLNQAVATIERTAVATLDVAEAFERTASWLRIYDANQQAEKETP